MALRRAEAESTVWRWNDTQAERQPAVSYLVRCWQEPREMAGEAAPFRGYVRDLRTSEERYFGDPKQLAEHILRRLEAERQESELLNEPRGLEGAAG